MENGSDTSIMVVVIKLSIRVENTMEEGEDITCMESSHGTESMRMASRSIG